MIVVTGATGNIGKKIAELLTAKNLKVRAIARDTSKLSVIKKADVVSADLSDVQSITFALAGADAAFIMIPPNYTAPDFRAYQNALSEALCQAIAASGIKYVVNLSSLGAHRPDKGGPINGIYDHEQRMNKLADVNVLHVRPTYFMENLLINVGLIKKMGIAGSPLRPDVSIPMIATQDIAAECAERLSKRDFSGKSVKELFGQRDLTMAEAIRVLGIAIGKPDLAYMQFPYDKAEASMQEMGLSPDVARLMIEMQRTLNEGQGSATQSRNPQNTTKTSIEDFAKTFAAIYRSSGN